MSILKRINDSLSTKANLLPAVRNLPALTDFRFVGNDITLYTNDPGEVYYNKGYSLNDAVYSIVSKNAEKASQVRLYHSRAKTTERKTLVEYTELLRGSISPHVIKEAQRMRKAMVEDMAVDSELSARLNKPNRYQTQSQFIEMAFAHRELSGEANLWLNDGEDGDAAGKGEPREILVIPKPSLVLVGNGTDPWEIVRYVVQIDGRNHPRNKSEIIRWYYNNPCPVSYNLEHLRGMAPLHAFLVGLQGLNEADRRVAISNKNGGAAGMAFKKSGTDITGDIQKTAMVRGQFDNAVNSKEMAGKIAIMGGDWGYFDFAVSIADQKLLEQYGVGFERLCRVFKTPAGLFKNEYSANNNQVNYKREWIYDKIAPNLYSLRDLLNTELVPRYGLNPERDFVDCDIMSLHDVAIDLKEQVTALERAVGLTVDQRLDAMGYPMIGGKAGRAILVPSGYQTLDDVISDLGTSNDADSNILDI